MTARIVTHAERPDLHERWDEVVLPAWPEFMLHDPVCGAHWRFLFSRLPEFQFYLYDDATDTVLGAGNSIPVAWDGTVDGLPDGLDAVLLRGLEELDRGVRPTALSALLAVVAPGFQGHGLSRVLVEAMRDVAVRHGLPDLIAPVRPTMKSRYPLTPIDRYVRWTREDGLPLDPWLRVHRRLGAEILRVASRSMVIRGTVAEWEVWTGLRFPESDAYVVPGALVPVTIDRERDEGRYVEPNVWMRHRLESTDV
jgi:GNAT superfamily N-acetyltransferase